MLWNRASWAHFAGPVLRAAQPFIVWTACALSLATGRGNAVLHCVVVGTTGNPGSVIELVVEDPQGLAEAVEACSDCTGFAHAWVWNDVQSLERIEAARLAEYAAVSSARLVTVRVRSSSTEVDLPENLVLKVAPSAMWREVPESMLPEVKVASREFVVRLPGGRESGERAEDQEYRLRVLGKGVRSEWQDVLAAEEHLLVEMELEQGFASPSHSVVDQEGVLIPEAWLTLLRGGDEGPRRVVSIHVADEQGLITVPSAPVRSMYGWMVKAPGFLQRAERTLLAHIPRRITLDRGRAVSGRVVSGRPPVPIAGAQILAESWALGQLGVFFRTTLATDDKGTFRFESLPLSEVAIMLAARGHGLRRIAVGADDDDLELGDIELSPAVLMSAQVIDNDSNPVVGAVVSLSSARAVSDEYGRAELSVSPEDAGDRPVLRAEADGFLDEELRFEWPLPSAARVRMTRMFEVRFELARDDGGPIEQARLKIFRELPEGTLDTRYREELLSDDVARVTLEPGFGYVLEIKSATSREISVAVDAGVPGEVRDLGLVTLPSGNRAYGIVADGVSGEPVAGAHVWTLRRESSEAVIGWFHRDLVETVTDPNGSFELAGLENGEVTLRIEAPEYARRTVGVDLPVDPAGAVADLGTILLQSGASVAVLHDRGGEARVDVGGGWSEADMLKAPILEGVAHFDHVPPGTHLVSVVKDHSLVCERELVLASDAVEENVDCSSNPAVGGLVHVGELPAEGGLLRWYRPDRVSTHQVILNRNSPLGLLRQQVFGGGQVDTRVEVGLGGEFRTESLSPGRWEVTWKAAGGGESMPRSVSIPRDQPEVWIDLQFSKGVLEGSVVDTRGAPVARARVRDTTTGQLVSADRAGRFAFRSVAPGAHRLVAFDESRRSEEVEVLVEAHLDTDPVTLLLDEGREQVLVRVAMRDGTPVAGALVLLKGGGEERIGTTGADGTARISFLGAAPERFRGAAFGGGRWALGDSATYEEAESGYFLWLGDGSLLVRSRSARGGVVVRRADGWNVTDLRRRWGMLSEVEPDRPFVLAGLPPGRYTIDTGRALRVVQLDEHDSEEVELP